MLYTPTRCLFLFPQGESVTVKHLEPISIQDLCMWQNVLLAANEKTPLGVHLAENRVYKLKKWSGIRKLKVWSLLGRLIFNLCNFEHNPNYLEDFTNFYPNMICICWSSYLNSFKTPEKNQTHDVSLTIRHPYLIIYIYIKAQLASLFTHSKSWFVKEISEVEVFHQNTFTAKFGKLPFSEK